MQRVVSRIGGVGTEGVFVSLFPGLVRSGCGGMLVKELVLVK
jgi:hypothetical protein